MINRRSCTIFILHSLLFVEHSRYDTIPILYRKRRLQHMGHFFTCFWKFFNCYTHSFRKAYCIVTFTPPTKTFCRNYLPNIGVWIGTRQNGQSGLHIRNDQPPFYGPGAMLVNSEFRQRSGPRFEGRAAARRGSNAA